MYYSNEDVDRFEAKLSVPGGESYVRRAALALGSALVERPTLYKTFGVYWWAVKAALRKYYHGEAWFMGPFFDQIMYDRAWHGSLARTVLAGAVYHDKHPLVTSYHDYTGKDGEDHQYTLLDEDAGF